LKAEVIYDRIDEAALKLPRPIPPPPLTLADPAAVQAAINLLRSAKNPLVIVGKVSNTFLVICFLFAISRDAC